MIERGMHVPFREEANEINGGIIFLGVIKSADERLIFKKTFVPDRHRDLRIVLIEHLAGAERQVPHLAVADLAPREPDGDARGLQARHGEIFLEPQEIFRLRNVDGIRFALRPDPPPVKHDKNDRFLRHQLILRQKKQKGLIPLDTVEEYLSKNLESDSFFKGDEIQLKLQKAVLTLPEKQRIVFNMRYYDETSYDDMAEILETSSGALRASYHIAAKKVEEYLLNS